jgi:hypothetical protein
MLAGAVVSQKRVDYAKVTELEGSHDCSQFTVQTAEEEIVCMRCGKVDD